LRSDLQSEPSKKRIIIIKVPSRGNRDT